MTLIILTLSPLVAIYTLLIGFNRFTPTSMAHKSEAEIDDIRQSQKVIGFTMLTLFVFTLFHFSTAV
ncbi:hypothetical protein [Motilimonas pumila]|uniref:Uncharacterized protein n=1 Tax=Motilimonas pumila TaxID=2303987 RepID=A0A418YGA2_9GAMM|nr:hypothetical protein [Motilimonas pumila]RJG48630.1 hypothetical protein D1Z90_07155 [Motilimonas pumila]